MSLPDEEFNVIGEDELALLTRRFDRMRKNRVNARTNMRMCFQCGKPGHCIVDYPEKMENKDNYKHLSRTERKYRSRRDHKQKQKHKHKHKNKDERISRKKEGHNVTEPPKIILYYHLSLSTWTLSNNKELLCRLYRVKPGESLTTGSRYAPSPHEGGTKVQHYIAQKVHKFNST
jgi:hypothetical protein